jgi:hypothetical protein
MERCYHLSLSPQNLVLPTIGAVFNHHTVGGWADISAYFGTIWRVLNLASPPLYPVTTLWKKKLLCMYREPNFDPSTGPTTGDSLFKLMITWWHLYKATMICEIAFTSWKLKGHTHTHTPTSLKWVSHINHLKPTGYVMHHQFNIQQLYVLPTLYLCVLYLSENKQRLVPLTA